MQATFVRNMAFGSGPIQLVTVKICYSRPTALKLTTCYAHCTSSFTSCLSHNQIQRKQWQNLISVIFSMHINSTRIVTTSWYKNANCIGLHFRCISVTIFTPQPSGGASADSADSCVLEPLKSMLIRWWYCNIGFRLFMFMYILEVRLVRISFFICNTIDWWRHASETPCETDALHWTSQWLTCTFTSGPL